MTPGMRSGLLTALPRLPVKRIEFASDYVRKALGKIGIPCSAMAVHEGGNTMFGILNAHKPSGITSRGVVNVVQRLVRPTKLGHAGTLDPLASGVLLICLGQATRLIPYLHELPKHYVGHFLLGRTSLTEDVEGEVQELENPPVPTLSDIETAARSMVGQIEQRPPAYSALKVNGRRAYTLARAGKDFELQPRPIVVHALDVLEYAYPRLTLDIVCGSGTYVRSLGRALAERVGSDAVMSGLVRTAIGHFRLEDAVSPANLSLDSLAQTMQSPLTAVQHLPQIQLEEEEVGRICRGQSIERVILSSKDQQWAAVDPQGRLLAILISAGPQTLRPFRCFAPHS